MLTLATRLRNIKAVQFCALSQAEWERFAIEIDKPYTRGGDPSGTPYDPRLGVLDNNVRCLTCGGTNKTCPGHFGFIRLAKPVYNLEYMDVVFWILKSVCPKCYSSLIPLETAEWMGLLNKHRLERLRAFVVKCESITICSCCGDPTPKITMKNNIIKITYGTKDKSTVLSAEKTLAILMQISNETMILLGFNENLLDDEKYTDKDLLKDDRDHVHAVRPESFIFTVFPVTPPQTRPWVYKGSDRRDDDLTEKYNVIIKTNNRLRLGHVPLKTTSKRKSTKLNDADRIRLEDDLDNHIWSLIDNTKEKNKTGRTHKGYRERLSSKEGHLQSYVAGKRVDETARSVIVGGGTRLRSGWTGMPESIAKILTIPEPVTTWNQVLLEKLLVDGKINRVKRQGYTINVAEVTKNFTRPFMWRGQPGLDVGDIVDRHIVDGDWGIFNRQPTLRIESMQGVRFKIMPGEFVLRLDLSQTKPLNADFDGDECNVHILQSMGARAECSTVMAVQNQILTRQSNSPIIGCVQNSTIASYLLTNIFPDSPNQHPTMVPIHLIHDIIVAADINTKRYFDLAKRARKLYPDFIVKKGKHYCFVDRVPGSLLISIVFPRDFSWKRETKTNEVYPVFEVEKGVITPASGPMCKKIIGGGANTAVHRLSKIPYSSKVAIDFISEVEIISAYYITHHGFSIGLADCLPTRYDQIESAKAKAQIECELILKSKRDPFEKERDINASLNQSMGIGPLLAKTSMEKGERNALVIMKKCGAKGTNDNNSQISAFVGQQNIDGKRMKPTLSYGTRTLTCFREGDQSPEARGFIGNSYLTGLNPYETWFHAATGRRGVITTALGTADTGYGQKKICKKQENIKQIIDGSARDSNGNVIQYLYGGDGMNAKHLIYVKGLDFPFFVDPYAIASTLNNRTELKRHRDPNAIKRKLDEDEIRNILVTLVAATPGILTEVTERATYNFRIILRALLFNVELYEENYEEFSSLIVDAFESNKSPAGEAIGLCSGSSIGEPTTQQNLSFFHSAGQTAKDVTLGIPRFKELLGATRNPSKPTCTVYLDDAQIAKDSQRYQRLKTIIDDENRKKEKKDKAQEKLTKLEDHSLSNMTFKAAKFVYITLGYLTKSFVLRYLPQKHMKKRMSPLNFVTYEEYQEQWWVTLALDLGIKPEIEPENWVIEVQLDLDRLYSYQITLQEISSKIEAESITNRGQTMSVIPSPDNLGRLEIYLNFSDIHSRVQSKVDLPFNSTRPLLTPENLDYFAARDVAIDFLKGVSIQGIKGVTKTYPRQDIETKEWLFDTQGTAFKDLLATRGVDTTRTISDDMWQIYEVLGIEATRRFLVKEITRIISFDGTYVNPRHIILLVDSMTHSGTITSVSRYGINRSVGPISKGMFEKPIDNFAEAAAFAEHDDMKSVASSVMFGTLAQVGTGVVDIKDAGKLPAQQRFVEPRKKPKNKHVERVKRT